MLKQQPRWHREFNAHCNDIFMGAPENIEKLLGHSSP
jgi:hypothetical protein